MHEDAPVCWAIIPVKAPGEGKSRLAGSLDASERQDLVAAMLERVVRSAEACVKIARTCLLGPSDHGLERRVALLADDGGGLNAALSAALPAAMASSEQCPDRLIVIPADLPQLEAIDLAMLADLPASAIGIAPDRHGTGTNGLSLPASAATRFRFAFGPDSYAAHRAEAKRLGYTVDTMLSDGLEKDIDDPADLADASGCLQGAL